MHWLASSFDLLQLWQGMAGALVVAILFGVILASIFGSRIKKYVKAQVVSASQTDEMHRAAKDPKDPSPEVEKRRLIPTCELVDAVKATQQCIETRCGSAHCPVVPVVQQWMTHAEEIIHREFKDQEKARQLHWTEINRVQGSTEKKVDQIFDRLNDFLNEVGTQMIQALRNGRSK